ncbi:MAG: hypothetical protein C3F07_04730 [Anaerolineales bacterium]|nr:hypothetical protein [Anaerolineae bacterium]PWB75643.1 MAG: hypothetical protein C3F07_04730 [Anaerolineales bacterium]
MKKTLLIVALVVLAVGALGVGVAFAQGGQPPFAGRGPMLQDGTGPFHTYMVTAFAEKLGLKVEDVNARLAAGETMYDIALADGVKAEDFPALMADVRAESLDAAVKDGVITQEQADWMKSRGFGRGGMMYGYGNGDCPMHDGQYGSYGPQGGRGPGGMMGGGWGWQNQ